ncbi:RNA-binding domain-containing protein [Durotheca rogersii]|uniref:RNA-binding domain-containing protein n=1 Tax=Durotheca rogersii TaxID=419775 RepID=UPI00221F06D8|nr:RNA-binding domain-containing protein [Durotheca rogersii]KAI5858271.1 RNA-binding domain-containing protein [Durotheca rogersii]
MDGFNPYNGKPPSNGSGSQGDAGSQGAGGAPGVPPSGLPIPPTNGQAGAEIAPAFGSDSARQTLWMGELAGWMDESFIRSLFQTTLNENVQVKIIRDRHSGSAGYCFVEFATPEAAQKALQLNGTPIPNTDRVFRLNWASGGGLVDRRDDRTPEYSIFVGDLGHEVNEFVLVALFQARFPSCKSAKIMTDQQTGQSRGYGFVRFSDEQDQQRALVEMQGVYCGNRPMRVSPATPKNRSNHQTGQFNQYGGHQMIQTPQVPPPHAGMGGQWVQQQPATYGYQQPGTFNPLAMNQFTDPNNTTVFVGGLSGYVTEDELRSFFQGFGEITYVKIPPGKGCGFVQFVHRHAAEMAINQMQGYPIGNSRVRLSWGRSQNNSGVGTPYRPAPPPPHYFPPGPPGPPGPGPGPFGGPGFGGSGHQGPPPGSLGPQVSFVALCSSGDSGRAG